MKATSSIHHCFLLLTYAIGMSLAAISPAMAATYSISNFDRLQGLIVYDVHEDAAGGIWLGTEAGIWRWRANGFEPVSSPTGTTAPSRVPAGWGKGAITIASDSNTQTLWIGTGGGLLALDMKSLEPKDAPIELAHAQINRLHSVPTGEVWAASTDGLYKLQLIDGTFAAEIVPESEGLCVEEFLKTEESLWIGTNQELREVSNGQTRMHFENEVNGRTMQLLKAANGAMWMGVRGNPGLYRMDATGIRKFGKEDGLLDDEVNSIAERGNGKIGDGEIWVGTERGAYRYLNGKFLCINRENGLEQDDVHSIRIDRDDEIWIGTFGGGIYLLRTPDILNYGIEDGLSSPFVSSICLTEKNSIMVGSLQGYSTFDLATHRGEPSEALTHINASACDPQGRIWLGGRKYGINDRNFAICLDTGKALEVAHRVNAFAFDADAKALIATSKGLFIETDEDRRQIFLINDQPDLCVNAVLVEPDGTLVVGTEEGLFLGTEGNWRRHLVDSVVTSLARSPSGDYWVGTRNSLMLISKAMPHVSIVHVDLRKAQCIVAQPNGVVWCGTEDGLLKINEKGETHRMTLADGLPSSDVRGIIPFDNRTLYVATTAGLAKIDAEHWRCGTYPPRFELEFWSRGDTLVRSAEGRMSMSVNDQGLVAEVSPRGLRHRVGMSYQYKIPGPIDSWSEWITHNRIILPPFKAGEYTMQVRGRNADGIISETAEATFEITAPFWQTTGFLAAVGVGMLSALGGSVYIIRKRTHYLQRIEHSERKYRSLVESLRVIPYQADARTGEFLYVGPQTSQILGHNVAAWLCGGKKLEMIPSEDASVIQSLWVKSQAIRGHCTGEHRLSCANGSVRWFRNIVSTGENETDSVISGLMIDITAEKRAEATEKAMRAELETAVKSRTAELTAANETLRKEVEERRRSEAALRQSEDRFSKTFNRSPVAMVLSTMQDGIVLDVNEAQLQMSGYSRVELIGKRVADINAWADMADRERFIEQLRRDGSISGFIAKFQSKDRGIRVGRVAAECIEHNGQMCLLSAGLDITDSYAIEKELEQQRRFLRQLVDVNPHFIFAKDAAGRFTLVNKAIAMVYGTTVENLIGKTDADFSQNQEEVAFFRAIDQEVMRSGREHRVEEVITDSNGNIRHLDTIKLPLQDDNGVIFGILGVATDITARKEAQDSLRHAHDELELRVQERTQSLQDAKRRAHDSEELLHRMTDAVPGAVYKYHRTKDGAQAFDFISRGCEELFEVQAKSIMEDFTKAWDPILPEDVETMEASIRKSAETLEPWTNEFRIRTPSGRLKWLRGSSRPWPADKDGTIIWNGILSDITEEKRIEQALRDSIERFSLIAEGAMDGLWDALIDSAKPWHSPDTTVYYSPRFKKMLGFEEHEMDNILSTWAERLHPDDREHVMCALSDHMDRHLPYETEYRLLTRSDKYRWFQARGQAVWDANGKPRRMAGSLNDITRRKQAEEQLRQSQKLEAIGTLASGIAHQFDNLFTAISAYTDLAKTTLPSTHHAVRALEKVEMTARHARGVTNALLTFSHQAGGTRTTLNLSHVVADTMQMLSRVLNSRISIELEPITQEAVWVSGDQTQIEQMLLNLAVNAQDAMPNGGRLRVSLSILNDGSNGNSTQTAVLAVTDTGTGISPDHLPRIFEPFFTTKPRGQGTGLGLSIILGIVKDLGGSIQVESEPGTGTTMTILIPCCAAPVDACVELPKWNARETTEHVIVIERNPHVRSIVTTTLRAVGCDVSPFSSMKEAIEFASIRPAASKIIVVDMDSVSPGEFNQLSALRERNADVKLIVIVGTLNIDLKRNRIDDCLLLRKPFEMPELTELVEDCLDGLSDLERGNNGE